jgi:hypothetical protein
LLATRTRKVFTIFPSLVGEVLTGERGKIRFNGESKRAQRGSCGVDEARRC